ncbi:hypothetical protein N9345_00735 [Candidatus Thioglobus sp.]|nr:hypothetical protein [Candidatus Thioglobus sp.]
MYDYYTEKPNDAHFRDIWLATLKPLGIKIKSNSYDLFITNTQQKQVQNFIKQYSSKFLVGINLEGAVKGKKIKYTELWKICQGLYKVNNNIQIIIITTPDNLQNVSKKLEGQSLDYITVSYKTNTILDVAALIQQLDLIITPDTSIVHIASAFNIPIVTIHEGNQDSYQLFAPISKQSRTVFSNSVNSLAGYSVHQVIEFSNSVIDTISREIKHAKL